MTRDAGSAPEIVVRDAGEADMLAVQGIYAHYVLSSLATFEETPPSLDVMLARRRVCLDNGLPYLVAVAGGEVVGFAYAGTVSRAPGLSLHHRGLGLCGRRHARARRRVRAARPSSSNAVKRAHGGR